MKSELIDLVVGFALLIGGAYLIISNVGWGVFFGVWLVAAAVGGDRRP